MVVNNIMMKLKNKEDGEKARALLEGMKGQIETLLDAKVYLNIGMAPMCYDLIYISKFENQDGSMQYVKHPVHVDVSKQLGEIVDSMVMVTYEE